MPAYEEPPVLPGGSFSLFSAQKVVVVMFKNHSRLSFRPLVFHLKIKYSRGGISWLVPDIPDHHWTSRGYVCIDGQHRIEKARRLGIKTLPAVVIRMEQHIPFLYDGYDRYTEYWNRKLKDRTEDALRWQRGRTQ